MTPYKHNILVATDLDGTLLDHHTYDWHAAAPSIEILKQLGIAIVFNTSKTMEEVLLLQEDIDIRDPFIVENGSALFIPETDSRFLTDSLPIENGFRVEVTGETRANIVTTLSRIRQQYGWRWQGFSDCSIADIQQLTGLNEKQAILAGQRRFSEPLIWRDSEAAKRAFLAAVENAGLHHLQGGRFLHILGKTDKGHALKALSQRMVAHTPTLIALGDSYNDLDMLAVAAYPVLVKSPVHDFPEFSASHLIKTRSTGPDGWNQALAQLLGTLLDSQ